LNSTGPNPAEVRPLTQLEGGRELDGKDLAGVTVIIETGENLFLAISIGVVA
jgi:hypothetical protein